MASEPARRRTEFNSDPKGLTVSRPRLSWWVNDSRPAEIQTAYHIVAASYEDGLRSNPDLWDSGVVDGDANAHVVYAGRDLPAGARVRWKVRTFDSDGLSSPWSATAYFEMSPVMGTAWKARWISTPLYGSRSRGVQVPILRREFIVDERPASALWSLRVLATIEYGPTARDSVEARVHPCGAITPVKPTIRPTM